MKDMKLSLIVQAMDRATAPLKRVGESLEHLREKTEHLQHAMHKLGVAEFVGLTFFTGAGIEAGHMIFELADKVAELGEVALHNSLKTGVSVEAIQQWTWAAKQAGVEADNLILGLSMMQLHLSNALTGNKESIAALKMLGIGLGEVKFLSDHPDKMFSRVISGFENVKNEMAKVRVGRALFGRQWLALAPLMMSSREDIEFQMKQLAKAHLLLSTDAARAGENYGDTLKNMGLAVQGLGVRIGQALIPKLTVVVEKVTDWIEGLKDDDIQRFGDSISQLADDFMKFLPDLERITKATVDFVDKLLKLASNTKLVKLTFEALVGFLAINAFIALVTTAANITSIGMAAIRAVPMIAALIPEIGSLTGAMAALSFAMDANPIGVLTLAIAGLIAALAVLAASFSWVTSNWSKIVTALQDGCLKIETAFKKLDKALPDWMRQQFRFAGSVANFVFPGLDTLGRRFSDFANGPRPASGDRGPGGSIWTPNGFSDQNGRRFQPSGGHLGTIVIQAAPDTTVKKMSSNGEISFQHLHRGMIVA